MFLTGATCFHGRTLTTPFLSFNKCDKSQQKVPYVYFWENEIFALSKKQLNKLSNDTKHTEIELLLLKIWEKVGVFFLLLSLYFTSYFAQYLKISLADIRYLLLWCISFVMICVICIVCIIKFAFSIIVFYTWCLNKNLT